MMKSDYKQIAREFLMLASIGKSRDAFHMFVGEGFKHHNIYFKGDASSLIEAMEENALRNPDKIFEIKHSLQDENMVAVHSHVRQTPDDLGAAVVHIFKFEEGKIIELWDMVQPVPKHSINENGMF